MNVKEFNSLEEIKKYYYEEINTYVFKEDGKYIDVIVFNFDLDVEASIKAYNIEARNIHARYINAWNIKALDVDACDIDACDINVKNINAWDIKARNIVAQDIRFYAVCYAGNNIKCKSIKSRIHNAKHFVLNGKLEVENEI